ncbi:MAG TPA: serine/threonine-protein kinase [Candidatus Polarisedimenticolia bacterium]|nr:serine/threonine-protein kinase [Candidatus Polarisedimenticolia bacterium]
MTPAKLGRFEILREIGKGAMGQVFLASDPKIQRQVAIKTIVLPPGTSAEEAHETSQRFLREAQAAGKLLHPNIVTIFDVGEDAGVSFIAMEYIEGETLEKYTKPQTLLSPTRVFDLVSQAAAALDYAHEHAVIHRDIKPANLMVLKDGTLKVTDFGLAKNPSANLTQAGVLLGTPSYMSPEQIQGSELDGRSDLFSLGVVLYELMTGVRPFEGESISTIIYRVMYEDPRPPAALNPALPPDVNVILERALAKKPEERYASGADLVADLRKAFAALPPDTLSRPFPGVGRGAFGSRPGAHPGTTIRKDRRDQGRRQGRPGQAPGEADEGARDGVAAPVPRQTLIAHRPMKIAAVIALAAVGVVFFPRFVNRHEPGLTSGPHGEPGIGEEALPVTPASLGGANAPAAATAVGEQVAIEIQTRPNGASVTLDSTPLAEPKIVLSLADAKPHEIVARAGCRGASARMTASNLASVKGPLVMELAPRKEDVLVGSDPAGARILMNGKDTGKVTPAAVTVAACEARTLALAHEGYRAWSKDYDADDDFDVMVETLKKVSLEAIPTGGLLVKKPREYDLEILSGEKRLGKAGDTIVLPEGKYALTFRNDTYFVKETQQVTVAGGRTTSPLLTFPLLGTLTVQAQPSNCKVFVDDRYVDVTPVLDLPISSGGHHVKVVFVPNGATQEVPVSVDGGKNARVVVKF